jgi:hypothetical protein
VTDWKFLLFEATCVTSLAYCFWKTHADWQEKGFGLTVVWGAVACLGAFFFVAFLLAGKALADL